MNTIYQVQMLMPVKVEVEMVTSRQDRERNERRERSEARQAITPEHTLDWRSYERRAVPARWRVR